MIPAPSLPKRPTEQDYRLRDTLWHLKELGEIVRASREGVRVNVRANLGRSMER